MTLYKKELPEMSSLRDIKIHRLANHFSSKLSATTKEVAIILAAGHGKRIKSQKSKMLHKIWGVPTVQRVYNACVKGLKKVNLIIVVGIKAEDVMQAVGKRDNASFAFQETQNGTGHAVQVALKKIGNKSFDGIVYVLPGDMGLLDEETIKSFRQNFMSSGSDMMVLTGIYESNPMDNSYGRIIRVKDKDEFGIPSLDRGKVIQIMENKDIHALPEDKPHRIKYADRTYSFTKKELVENNEFNSGVYAFKYSRLKELVKLLSSNNVQKEIYITDLIELFNVHGYAVQAVSPKEQYVVMGFNNKSVLKEMEAIARKIIYEKLKDVIEIEDPDNFFIHDEVVDAILKMDKKNIPLDITIGRGVHIDAGVKLNYDIELKREVYVAGNVHFGKNVIVWQNAHLSTFPEQTFKIGNNVEVLWGDIIKGNITIGDNSRIESSVNMTGSDEFPVTIGKKVLIKGTSYLFGTQVGDNVNIEHSVLIKKQVKNNSNISFYLPVTLGAENISDLPIKGGVKKRRTKKKE
jgi:bifunctional UDP-N-acetylglucosamine pyrophosphorylase/glucosamine-1-phosphate N-acetyltransferase